MNLLEMLLQEHSKAQRDRIVHYVGKDARRFNALIKLFLKGPYRITQRAAWPLSYCVEQHPNLVKPHLGLLIHHVRSPGLHDSVKRNILRLLQFISIPKSLHGTAATLCFELFQNRKEPIAVRVFSMTVLANIAHDQPGLKKELAILIEDQLPYASAGFRSRARKVLKQLA